MYRENYNKEGWWYSDSKNDWVDMYTMSTPQLQNTILKCEKLVASVKNETILKWYRKKLEELNKFL